MPNSANWPVANCSTCRDGIERIVIRPRTAEMQEFIDGATAVARSCWRRSGGLVERSPDPDRLAGRVDGLEGTVPP